jgi:hypothetical protein
MKRSETYVPEPISVNEAIGQAASNAGEVVVVEGILNFEFEDVSLHHYPVSERRDDRYGSAIWLSAGMGSIQLNEPVLERWSGKRVVVTGTIHGPSAGFGGCGHGSLFPAEILVASIERP